MIAVPTVSVQHGERASIGDLLDHSSVTLRGVALLLLPTARAVAQNVPALGSGAR
jgi:hypothetical protein